MSQGQSDPRIVRRPSKESLTIPPPNIQSAGIIVNAADLTPYELQKLKEMGYDGTSDVPSNLAEMYTPGHIHPTANRDLAAQVAKAQAAMPDGFRMPTKDFDLSSVPVITDERIVAAEMSKALDKYTAVVGSMMHPASPAQSAFEAARAQGVNAIHKTAQEANVKPQLMDAMRELEYAFEDGTESGPEQPPSPGQPGIDPGLEPEPETKPADPPMSDYDILMSRLDKQDVENYRTALLTMSRFEKTYKLLGGEITAMFSDCGPDEDAMSIQQESIDSFKGRYDRSDIPSFLNVSSQYSFVSMLREVHIVAQNKRPIAIPSRLTLAQFLETIPREGNKLSGVDPDDTNIRLWYKFVSTHALTGSLYRLVYRKFEEFRSTLVDLQRVSQHPSFFVPPAQ